MGGIFSKKGESGFSVSSTAEKVTQGIDGSGLTAIVTGASSGIGVKTSCVLALCRVHVVMAVRNMEAGSNIKEAILKEVPNAKIGVMELDLSSLASVRKFATDYTSSGLPLNILTNNAGIMATPFKLSKDNIELHFATNHLGHFLLTNLLLETMKTTSRERKTEGRIVNVSSLGHRYIYSDGFCFDKISDDSRYQKYYAYGQSKLTNILHANELTRRLKDEGAEVTANFMRYDRFLRCLLKVLGILGAATTCFVALHRQVKGIGGKYFVDCNVTKPSSQAKDADLAAKLWDFSLSLTNPE
ncbi:short-chain dehydrogenase TIC 32, chloroplastic-like [Pyrus communis]|uniref:short-chain dehydrogenase TIC 32, chloroplastic-like n=1 Tax=Pyrus communis TaxID=23211 RepID=UPI0035C12061